MRLPHFSRLGNLNASHMTSLIELVQAFREATDPDQWNRLAEKILAQVMPAMRGIIARNCRPEEIEDLAQVVSWTIATRLDRFTGQNDAALWAWCGIVTRRKCIDAGRRRPPTVPFDPELLTALLEASRVAEPCTESTEARLRYLLDVLAGAGECREILYLYAIGVWDVKEFAKRKGITWAAARMRLSRCIKAGIERYHRRGEHGNA